MFVLFLIPNRGFVEETESNPMWNEKNIRNSSTSLLTLGSVCPICYLSACLILGELAVLKQGVVVRDLNMAWAVAAILGLGSSTFALTVTAASWHSIKDGQTDGQTDKWLRRVYCLACSRLCTFQAYTSIIVMSIVILIIDINTDDRSVCQTWL